MDTFNGCTALKEVNLPKNLKYIAEFAFEDCTSLETIVIPDTVTSIAYAAFRGCTSLNLVVPDSVVYIADGAFGYVPHIEYHGTAKGAPWGAKSMN